MTTNDVSDTRISDEQLTAYEMQVLIGTTIHGCNMSPDRVFSLDMAWHRLHTIGLIDRTDGLAIATDKGRAVVAAALASRHPQPVNEPGEWQVRRAWTEFNSKTHVTHMDAMRAALRAASIPASERSKGVKEALLNLERYHQMADGWGDEVLGLKQHPAGDYVKWTDILTVCQSLPALETPPLHKEGEANAAWLQGFEKGQNAAPVPVTITDEMANAAIARSKQKDLDLLTNTEAMRQIIAAALSAKPAGEE